jgi:hypothetical protein
LGLDLSTAQLALAVVVAALAVSAQRSLRPQIDRVFFRERYALERGVAGVLGELSEAAAPEALYSIAGARLDELVRPEFCVLYARVGDAFTPAFVRGSVAPAAFAASGALVAALAQRTTALVARAWRRGRAVDLRPFDRAVLETLDAAVILPIRRWEDLIGFVCLGEKRSGDIYTATDLALLDAVAHKVSDELVRFDLADVVARTRAMEQALRSYVPSAVTAQLDGGGSVEPTERQVSVLFVDIRGYTSFAERHEAADVFSTINRYTETVSRIARERGGAVAEFGGDG